MFIVVCSGILISVIEMCVCCFTGHRDFDREKCPDTYLKLIEEIKKAYEDGCDYFITGAAKGLDYEASFAVNSLKAEGLPIKLEAAVPYPQMINYYQCAYTILNSDVNIYIGKNYTKDIFHRRNRYMVDKSDVVIAVYDGRESGGTYYTMKYAQKCGKNLVVINY